MISRPVASDVGSWDGAPGVRRQAAGGDQRQLAGRAGHHQAGRQAAAVQRLLPLRPAQRSPSRRRSPNRGPRPAICAATRGHRCTSARDDGWSYAVAEGDAILTPPAAVRARRHRRGADCLVPQHRR